MLRTSHVPVHRFVVSLVRHDLWCKVVGRTTKRPCLVRHSFREAKVRDLEVSMPVEQQVFWFQVAVYNVALVQVFES